MFSKFFLIVTSVTSFAIIYTTPVFANISHSSPWGGRIQRSAPKRWSRKCPVQQRTFPKNILVGLRFGWSSLSGVSSLIMRDQKGSHVREVMEGEFSSNIGLSGGLFCEYRRRIEDWAFGISSSFSWSNGCDRFDQLYPRKSQTPSRRVTIKNPCTLQQTGLIDAALIFVYSKYFLKPFVKVGAALSGFKFTIRPDHFCNQNFSRHFLVPGLSQGCGLDVLWKKFGLRISYTYTLYKRWKRDGNDPLTTRVKHATHKISGLEQHMVALSTFIRL